MVLRERLEKFRSFRLFLDICVRCGACADKCHFFIGSGDPKNMPVLRAELLRSVYRQNFTRAGKILGKLVGGREMTVGVLKEWFMYAYQCTECRRCSVFCPYGIDTAEITRKITNGGCEPCGGGSFGYKNEFVLLLNGTGYELIPDGTTPGRYHTKNESFLYIQLHNNNLGNNTPAASNATGEWWEVVEKDGTRWRLGWTTGSEQLAAMKGYPGAATGASSMAGSNGLCTDTQSRRKRPVCDALTLATSSGVPAATMRPPSAPPSGPRSTM